MRTLVIGDIHSGLRALKQVLDRAKVTPADTLIFMGDYIDGWSEAPQTLDFLIDLGQKQKCIFIKGNHDQLFLDWLEYNRDEIDENMWRIHGGDATLKAYETVSTEDQKRHIAFLHTLQNYYFDSKNRLFIHAGFTNPDGVDKETTEKNYYWDRSLWDTALNLDKKLDKTDSLYPKILMLYNEIYIGHTPVTKIGKTVPIHKACVWNVDTGAAFIGPLTIMDVDTKEYWQSDPLPVLYPDEKGRNQ